MRKTLALLLLSCLAGCGEQRPAPWMDNFAKLTTIQPVEGQKAIFKGLNGGISR